MTAERGNRSLGVVYTPPDVSQFMVDLAVPPLATAWSVLEPACADAPFLQAFARKWGKHHKLTGVEYDQESNRAFHVPNARHVQADYLLWQPQEQFDVIVGNPPYGIIGDASHYPIHGLLEAKQQYKQRFQTWHGKYNVYGAFIEQSVNLLKDEGHLIFVVPTTWLVLDDFAPLRRFLAERGAINIYYLGKAFPKVTVVAVVLHFVKGEDRNKLALYDKGPTLAYEDPHYHGDLICFHTPQTEMFEQQSKVVLGDVFDVRFAARSPEYQKSPWVSTRQEEGMEVVLTGRNLKPGAIDYNTNYSGLWMKPEHVGHLREIYTKPHLVVAHTKGARVVAAYDTRCAAWREEFHLVPKMPINEQAVADYLNSEVAQDYVQTLYRDLSPHLTRTQLKRFPMPPGLTQKLFADQPVQLSLIMERRKAVSYKETITHEPHH